VSSVEIFETALAFAKAGLEVFPVPPGTKMGYSDYAEAKSGTKWGKSKDPEVIRRYWTEHPDANLGFPCGPTNGFWVLEYDTIAGGHSADGASSLAALEAEFGPLPPTRRAVSPSGSMHYYFKHPGYKITGTANIRPGLDVRGDGNMVLLPPSVKPGVGAYRWLNNLPYADAPQWLLDLLKTTKTTVEHTPIDIPPAPPGLDRAGKALHDAYHRVAQTGLGMRNETLNTCALKLGKFVGAGDLDEQLAIQTLINACKVNGSFDEEPRQCLATINSGMPVGKKDPVRTVHTMFGAAVAAQGMPTVASPPTAPTQTGTMPVPPTADDEAKAAAKALADAREKDVPTPKGGFIKTSAQFMAGRKPPDYLIRPIFKRRFLYAMTAQTDTGKTNVALRLAAHVAIGRAIDGNVTCKPGTVIYFVGENPEDVADRWLALCDDMKIDSSTVDVHFIPEAMHLSKVAERITQEVTDKKLQVALIVVDTSAAYFEGENESDPIQALEHAKRMRTLTLLPGGPCVLILCHPVKGAKDINDMVPRGGSGFVNEVDGNLGLYRTGDVVTGQKVLKFRGQRFDPISFEIETVFHPDIKDSDGLPMPTVVCRPIGYADVERAEDISNKNDVAVLKTLCDHQGLTQAHIAKALGWLYMSGGKKGKPNGSKVRDSLMRLKKAKLADEAMVGGGLWTATTKGQKAANLIDSAKQKDEVTAPPLLPAGQIPIPTRPAPPMPPGMQ
jgi:hypothetical protein